MQSKVFLCCFLSFLSLVRNFAIEINVGVIFLKEEYDLMKWFYHTIDFVNEENRGNFKLIPLVRQVAKSANALMLQDEVNYLIQNHVSTIFGPTWSAGIDVVAAICERREILHLVFTNYRKRKIPRTFRYKMTFNMYPSEEMLAKGFGDIVRSYGWKKFVIISNSFDVGTIKRHLDLMQSNQLLDSIYLRQFNETADQIHFWKSIRMDKNIILDCTQKGCESLFHNLDMLNLDIQLKQLLLFNIRSPRFHKDQLKNFNTFTLHTSRLVPLNYDLSKHHGISQRQKESEIPNIRYLLLRDAVFLYATFLQKLKISGKFEPSNIGSRHIAKVAECIYCQNVSFMPNTLEAIVSSKPFSVQFDENGDRREFTLEVIDPISKKDLFTWDTNRQLVYYNAKESLQKTAHYKVATRLGDPYFMENPDAVQKGITGTDRYMGYAVDLIRALAQEIGFNYTFIPVSDNAYGTYNLKTKKWNGIIGELINNDAHMGICDLTITQARKGVVDFTVPFMQLGISILAYQKTPEYKKWYSFLDPFTPSVWMYIMISVFIVAFNFLCLARISSNEWEKQHPCVADATTLENKWGICNSLWLAVGSIMTAGSDTLPKNALLRIFNAMWWIFAIIIANSYTANLAAFLTNIKMEGSIRGIEDLAEQTDVKFGTMEGGSTYYFFSESNETTYRLAFNIMQNNDPSVYTKGNQEGVERVLRNTGSYMFLMETTSLEYNTERNCHLTMLGDKFGEKHYAIAVPFGAPYRSSLSVGILKLSEKGELFRLKNKWWKNHSKSCPNELEMYSSVTPDMIFSEVRGIFYTLFVGIVIAYTIGIIEFFIHSLNIAVEEKLSFSYACVKELRLVLNFRYNKKPITSK